MILYHIHKHNKFDSYFKEGNTFECGNSINHFTSELMNTSGTINLNNKSVDMEDALFRAHLGGYCLDDKSHVMNQIQAYLYNSKLNTRELILEQIRLQNYSNLPSRFNCIWLCDEECISTWLYLINSGEDFNIFEVEVGMSDNDNIFQSSSSLLPKLSSTNGQMFEQAKLYWNPSEEFLEEKNDLEYLYTGNVRVRKRII